MIYFVISDEQIDLGTDFCMNQKPLVLVVWWHQRDQETYAGLVMTSLSLVTNRTALLGDNRSREDWEADSV